MAGAVLGAKELTVRKLDAFPALTELTPDRALFPPPSQHPTPSA